MMSISLTNYTTSAVSAISQGSAVEIAGGFFLADSEITINASSWTAISTTGTAYLALTPSGSAGSQTLAAAWTSTAPTWSESKQGWYATAASNTRVVGSCYKNGTASYTKKYILNTQQDIGVSHIWTDQNDGSTSGLDADYLDGVHQKSVAIGEWNMDDTATVYVGVDITVTKIRTMNAIIYADNPPDGYNISYGGYCFLSSGASIGLQRNSGGAFDNTSFNATASTVANRGWVTITYID
jgi:hypothetical protein